MSTLVDEAPVSDDPQIIRDLEAWREKRCQASMQRLLLAYEKKIENMARKRTRDADIRQDLMSAGRLAMMRAADNYRQKPGIPFFAYAAKYIRSAMQKELRFNSNIVKIPDHKLRDARTGKMDNEEVALLEEARFTTDIEDIFDISSSPVQDVTEASLIQQQNRRNMNACLQRAFECLSPGEAKLLTRRLEEEAKGNETLDRLDINDGKMRKMEQRAMMRLKTALLKQGFTPQFLTSEI